MSDSSPRLRYAQRRQVSLPCESINCCLRKSEKKKTVDPEQESTVPPIFSPPRSVKREYHYGVERFNAAFARSARGPWGPLAYFCRSSFAWGECNCSKA
jgi:hypothetical protein